MLPGGVVRVSDRAGARRCSRRWFELCGALLCAVGPVRTLVDLALAPEHRRGHGALYAGLNQGRIDVTRLRRALVSMP